MRLYKQKTEKQKTHAPLEEACACIAADRINTERKIVACVAAHPTALIPAAAQYGADQFSFSQEDLRLIFVALDVCRDCEPDHGERIIVRALRENGYWWTGGPNSFGAPRDGPLWTDAALHAMLHSQPPCVVATRFYCRRLADIQRREQLASHHIAAAVRGARR